MKKILFATDFSPNARQAFDYTVELANQLRVEIVVIHVVNLYPKADMMLSVEKRMIEDNERQLDWLMDIARERLFDPNAISGKVVKGETVKRLKKIAEQLQVDLVVTATKGEKNAEDYYLGRTSGSLIKETETPLLFIPPNCPFQPIEDIVFAIKSPSISSASVVEPLLSICRVFEPQLHLLKVNLPDEEEQEVFANKLFLEKQAYQLVQKSDENITRATQEYVQAHPTNLVCGIRRKRGFFQKFLTRNGVKKETFNLDVPFLILRGSNNPA